MVKDSLHVKKVDAGEKSPFEFSEWVVLTVALANLRFSLFTGFRILLNIRSQQALFIDAFTSYLESLITSSELLLITGDFGIHVDHPCDPDCMRFLDLLESMGLQQQVDVPTLSLATPST